ncbi:molybdopterin-dependent oxidoreductase [Haladaptatus sp. YSMS36]|uniref:molybdopterin-dependent oxidoreductase n=1 Tax=Haladaptatus sp. YSMS36 TaxID=3033384 RepID=UPI0023E8B3D3|nr:molybdopterin-dependent oxidoreductase [Haladaptatus sp. YSMS36]
MNLLPRSRLVRIGIARVLLAGVAAVAGSYAAAGFTPGFVGAPLEATLSRVAPASLVTFAIVVLGDLGQKLNLFAAITLAVLLIACLSAAALATGWRQRSRFVSVTTALGLTWAAVTLLTAEPVLALAAAIPAAAVLALTESGVSTSGADSRARRRVLTAIAGVAGFSLLSYVLGSRDADETADQPLGLTPDQTQEIQTLLAEAEVKSLAVAGLEPLVSTSFYEVDIAAVNPRLAAEEWTLTLTGAVDKDLTITYDDLRALPVEQRFVTLRCVGDSLNGQKMDTALWTGTPLAPILDRVTPASGCECAMLHAGDGYYVEFPIAALRTGFLTYGMNGNPLPRSHGAPVRVLIPGHWGEVNVKWLTEIEFLDKQVDGYWEERGWHGTGPVNLVAKLWLVNDNGDGTVTVGGHAYAGLRDISAVEVTTGGGNWEQATLSEPLPGEDVWRQWTYTYDHPGSQHRVTARAVAGDGTVQSREELPAFPSGPSGWVSQTVR